MGKRWFGWVVGIEALAFTLLEGSMLTLGALVAPILFKNIKSADQAGRIFGKILGAWFWVGLACTLLLLLTSLLTFLNNRTPRRLYLARFLVLLSMLGLIVAFGFVLNRIEAIQESLVKPIEEYPTGVVPRLEFDQLHKLSTNLLSLDLLLGLVWLSLSIFILAKLPRPSEKLKQLSSSETAQDPRPTGVGV